MILSCIFIPCCIAFAFKFVWWFTFKYGRIHAQLDYEQFLYFPGLLRLNTQEMPERGGDKRKNRGIATLNYLSGVFNFPVAQTTGNSDWLKNNTYSDNIKTHHSAGFIL